MDPTGSAYKVQLVFRDGELTFKESSLVYGDMLAAKGLFKPGIFEGTTRFFLKDGKLQCVANGVLFDVDPETLNRTPSKDRVPTMSYTEIERK